MFIVSSLGVVMNLVLMRVLEGSGEHGSGFGHSHSHGHSHGHSHR